MVNASPKPVDEWGKDLGETCDPRELIPGNYEALMGTAQALLDGGSVFENAGKTIHQLDLGQWRGQASHDYQGISRLLRDHWYRQSDLARLAFEAIKDYAHTGLYAQGQAAEAVRRWEAADLLQADAERISQRDRRDIDQATHDRIQAARQNARDILHDARGSLAEAEDRFETGLDRLARELLQARADDPRDNPIPFSAQHPAQSSTPAADRAAPAGRPAPGSESSPGTHPASTGNSPDGGGTPAPPQHPPTPAPTPTQTPPRAPAQPPPVSITVTPAATPTPSRPPRPGDPEPRATPPVIIRPHNPGNTPEPRDHDGDPPPSRPPSDGDRPPTGQPPTRPNPPGYGPAGGGPVAPPDAPAHPPTTRPPDRPPDRDAPHGPPVDRSPLDQRSPEGRSADPDGRDTGARPGTDTDPTPTNGSNGSLAVVLAAAGGVVAVGGAVGTIAWIQHRRCYPIGSGRRDDYPPAPPVVAEFPDPDTDPDIDPSTGTGHLEHSQPGGPGLGSSHGARAPVVHDPARSYGAQQPDAPVPAAHQRDERPVRASEIPVAVLGEGEYDWLDLAAAPGISIEGNGATDVLRAMIATIVADEPHGLDTPGGRVLITETDAGFVLGASRGDESMPERLVIVPDLPHALDMLHHQIRDRAEQPDQDPEPFVLALAHPPVDSTHRRDLTTLLAAGHRTGVNAIILGDWPTAHAMIVDHRHAVVIGIGEAVAHLVGRVLHSLPRTLAVELLTQIAQSEHTPDSAVDLDTRAVTDPGTCPDNDHGDELNPAQASQWSRTTGSPRSEDNPQLSADTAEEPNDAIPTPRHHRPHDQAGPASPPHGEPLTPADAPSSLSVHAEIDSPDDPEVSDTAVPEHTDARRGAQVASGPVPHSALPPVPPLRLAVLGRVRLGLTATADDPFSEYDQLGLTPKLAELFAFLALHRDGVARDTLADTVWPGSRPSRPTNGMHSALNKWRQLIKNTAGGIPNPIVADADGVYRLDPTLIQVDLWVFQTALQARAHPDPQQRENAYQHALSLYRGEFAEGVLKPEWITIPRENLRRDALDTAAGLSRILIEQHKHEQALAVLEKAKDYDPYNESVYQRIIGLQRRLGRLEDAARTLTLLTMKLKDIDAEPLPETIELTFPPFRGRLRWGQ